MFLIALALAATQAEPAPGPAAEPAEPAPQPMTVEVVRDAINDRLRATATLRANGERIEIRCRRPIGATSASNIIRAAGSPAAIS